MELRRRILIQTCKGMTIDQRRAVGVLPAKLVVQSVIRKLKEIPRIMFWEHFDDRGRGGPQVATLIMLHFHMRVVTSPNGKNTKRVLFGKLGEAPISW